jgi:tetratricopeptide (TPR) repeat protein
VSKWAPFRLTVLCLLSTWAFSARATDTDAENLDRQFKSAVADYNAGHFAEAADRLQNLLPHVPNSFEVHELLGLTYASLSQDKKAIEQLQAAVRIKPDDAPARTNLAASLSHAGETALAGDQFRKAFELEPHDYTANHNLGEFYIQTDKLKEACPLLERAQQLKPDAYDNGYDLAMADFLTGQLSSARTVIQGLLSTKNNGELHNLLGQIDEKDGKFLDAAKEYETAAHIDPSDDNLFAWGSELLLHRTYEPAVEVFKFATERYPDSPRLQIGLGMALYARGLYEDSVNALLKAVDLSPDDPRCYQFLARAYDSSPKQVDEVIQRFQHYAELQPGNARAQYYYAMSLWKGKRLEQGDADPQTVELLLKKSIALDGTQADAHVQLGNLYADQHEYQQSIPEYERALGLDPNLPDAHYRLGTDYVHVGEKDKAQQEFAVYQKLRAEHLAEDDKARAEVQQFVYAAKSAPATRPQ